MVVWRGVVLGRGEKLHGGGISQKEMGRRFSSPERGGRHLLGQKELWRKGKLRKRVEGRGGRFRWTHRGRIREALLLPIDL